MGHFVQRKRRKNKLYLYYCKVVDGERHEISCGPVGDIETEKKSDAIELAELRFEQSRIDDRIKNIDPEEVSPKNNPRLARQIKEITEKLDKLNKK